MQISNSPFAIKSTLIVVSFLCFMLASCSFVPESMSPARKITVNIKASNDINPGKNNQPQPLTLIIYELKDSKAFADASFLSLHQNASAVLGADLLGEQRVYVKPGDKFAVKFTTQKDTKYLGIVAAYENIDAAKWRLVVPLKNSWSESIWINANQLEIKRWE